MSEITQNDIPVNIENIMHTAYLQYSLSVNVGRAIPDVRDGLKPCNRRILYAMRQLGLTKSHAYTKSAKVVGEVIGNYHPHGDASVYDTLVRMAQDFSMRYELIDGQGNFGSIDGDPPAAYRYTECRMERLAEELLADIEKDTVDMLPTFDEANSEPTVLPASYPNLLVNGSTGIGVGMAINVPPHNLGEIIDATIELLGHPTTTIARLMDFIKGPDFPTGAILRGRGEIHKLYHTGRGIMKIRSKAEIFEKDGRETIIITEIPYAVNKENMIKRIAELVNEKKIVGISALRDETSRRAGIRIVAEVKRGAMGSVVLNQLYAHTQLETGYACTLLVVDHNRPRIMDLKQLLQAYIDHRMEVVIRRAKFELKKAEDRAHILEGLLIAVKNIDEVVRIIRESRDRAAAAEALIARFGLSRIQAAAILEMRLHQLTGLAIEDLQREYDEVMRVIEHLKALLASREMRVELIKKELLEVKEKFADARRTSIENDDGDLSIADLIERHSCVITVSNTGYIKRMPADTFRTQRRGGVGVMGMETNEADYVDHLFSADCHDLIFFFTENGTMHWLNVYEIPEGTRTSMGKAIVNLIKVEPGEQVRAMLTVDKADVECDDKYLIMATHKGVIKKTRLSAFKNLRKAGIKAIMIDEGDDLIGVAQIDRNYEIILSSSKGMACRFKQSDVRLSGRVTRGVTGIRFKIKDDSVVSMVAVPSEEACNQPEIEPSEPVEGELEIDAAAEGVDDAGGEKQSTAMEATASTAPQISTECDIDADEEPEEAEESAEDDATVGGPELLVVSDGGMGKRSFVRNYRLTKRGAKGVLNMRLKEGENVISALQIEKGDEILFTTVKGQVVRTTVEEIRIVGRASVGVRIMKLRKDDKIVSITKLAVVDLPEGDIGDDALQDASEETAGFSNMDDAAIEPASEPPLVDDTPEQ